jgi:hypothetical protein
MTGYYLFKVDYRRSDPPTSRTYHRVVVARDVDEARIKAKLADPLFYSTTRTPRRGAEVRP